MTEGPGSAGTAFFSVQNNFKATAEEFAALEKVVSSTLSSIRGQFGSFSGVDFNPLDKVYEKVNQQAGLIERRLQELFRKYQTFAKQGQTPEQPFALAANAVIGKSLTQVDRSLTSQAGNLGQADLAELRRTLIQGLAEGGTAAARELQSQLRTALKDSGGSASALVGSANTLRAGVLTRPLLQDAPDIQSAQDFVAATKNATRARQDAAKASEDAAAADAEVAKVSKEAAAKTAAAGGAGGLPPVPPPTPPTPPRGGGSSGSGGGTPPPTPPTPPTPPGGGTPPPPPPTPPGGGGSGGGGGGFEEVLGEAEARALQALRERIQRGEARFINGSDAVFDPSGPGAARGQDIVSGRTGAPIPAILADRLRRQVENQVAELEQQLTSGSLVKLGSRFATQPIGATDTGRTFQDRITGQEVDNEKDLAAATSQLAEARRKAFADSGARIAAEAERRYAAELLRLAEDVAAKRKAGIQGPDTGVRLSGQNIIDQRSGTPNVFQRAPSGGIQEVIPELQPLRFSTILLRDQQQTAAAETAAYTRAIRDEIAAARELEASHRTAARQSSRSGIGNNFLSGLTSGGFSGDGTAGIDGLARAAGTTLKYSTLYQTLGLVQKALHAGVQGFLDANDSITEYQVATGRADAVTAQFQTTLEGIAQVSGFNVGEALDVAAKGARAFGDEIDHSTKQGQDALDRMAVGFTQQARTLATLSKTTLTDAAGNLTSVAAGFDLPKNNAGFSRVTDAIAGAKLAGGGDETQIFQGLANSAIVFKQLGFNLNESATILSKINSQTDESGTLIANRLSRLTGILNGAAAGKFIQSLNQQLPADQQVDRTASQRDQLLKLSEAFQKLDTARQGTLLSTLGGTAQERELSVLLKDLPQIVDEAKKIEPGAGLKEFETRLTNVRAVLTEIQGFVKTIIVNLTTSGLADPIVELVLALRSGLQVLSTVSQGFKDLADLLSVNIGGANVSIVSLIANVGALGIALKALSTIRSAGGIRGALGAAEERIAPGRALARQQLAGINGTTGATPTTPPGTLLAGVQGRALQASQAADLAVQLPHGVAADTDVRLAGDDVKAAALRLAAAEDAQAALINRQTEERRAFAANNPGDSAGLRALNEKQTAERTTAAQAGITSQLDLTTAQAQLARALRLQAAQAEISAEFDARRASITGQFQSKIGSTIGQFQAAEAKGDARGVQAALDREAVLREQFNARLAALEAEQIVAEQRATAIANASLKTRIVDGGTGGALGAVAAARAEGAGVIRSTAAFGGTLLSGIRTGLTSLFRVLGPVGIGLTAIDFGLQVKGATDEINRARQDLRDVNVQFENKPLTTANLRDNASNEKSAAQNLIQARSGFTGAIGDFFVGTQGSGPDIEAAQNLSAASTSAANAVEAFDAKLRSHQTGIAGTASTIDITSPDTIKTSFDQLQSAGFTTAESMNILIERIKELRLVIDTTAQLTPHEKNLLAQGAGVEAVKGVSELPATQRQIFVGSSGGTTDAIPGSAGIQTKGLHDRVASIVQGQLDKGIDLSSPAGEQALEQALVKGYGDLVPDKAKAAQLAHIIGQYVFKQAKTFATEVNSLAQLQDLITQGFATADADAQSAQRNAQLKALTGGTRDNSAAVAAKTRVDDLSRTRAEAQAKLAPLVATGQLSRKDADSNLQELDAKITDARIQQLQALNAQAQQALQDSTLIRRNEQGKAKTDAQIKAIGQKFLASDIKTALATNDVDTIRGVFDLASQAEVNAILKELDDLIKTRQYAAAAAAARARAAAALLTAVNTSGRDVAGGAAESIEAAGASAAIAAANRAARGVQSAKDQAAAAHKAAQESNPQNVYDTGSDRNGAGGDTAAQIAAAFAQAKAVRDRNSTEGLRAAVQAAQADYDAAKDQKAKAQALQQLYAAENALADGLRAIGNARRFVNIFPASQIQTATKGIADARLELAKTAGGTIEYYTALASLVQAQRQLSEAQGAAYFLRQKLGTDLTNPVAQARLAVREAASKLRLLQQEGAPRDLQDQARLDLKNAQNQSESAAFSQRLSDAQTNDQLGRISHAAYIRYLDNEHNRLTAIRHRTRQQQDELNQIDQAIKGASQELQGQFNLGDIKLPTPYEVRRYIATQAKAATLTATAAAASGAAAGSSSAVSIVVNGADIAFVRRVLAEYLGPSATSTRAVSASRKG